MTVVSKELLPQVAEKKCEMGRTIKLFWRQPGFLSFSCLHYRTESKNSVVKRAACHMSNCPRWWVGTMCMSPPVADLGPSQTGHGLFQVLPQVSNVLHCPHASHLRILSCRHHIEMIHPKFLDLHAHSHGDTMKWIRHFCRMSWSADVMTTKHQWQPTKKKTKTKLSTPDKWGDLWWLSRLTCTTCISFGGVYFFGGWVWGCNTTI